LTLSALRVALQQNALTPRALSALKNDPRAGARALWATHEAQKRNGLKEAARLDALLAHEQRLWSQGLEWIGGLDEVGVGPLVGPVVAAVVVLPQGARIDGVDDSKKLSKKKREQLSDVIQAQALGVGMGACSALEIDVMNIFRATREAMRRAVMALSCQLDHLLVDAHRVPGIKIAQTAIIGGDRLSHAIAAASIVAKVARDKLMADLDAEYPDYGFGQHMGYGTAMHLEALQRLGPTPQHRRSFAPVRLAHERRQRC
jgi:ribonuclease HII